MARGRRYHAARIAESWQESVENIIETGRRTQQAKAELSPDEYRRMVEEDLPFGIRTAQRLIKIAESERLKATHVSLLPPSWGTLHELTALSDEEWKAIKPHLRSDLTRPGLNQLIHKIRRPPEIEETPLLPPGTFTTLFPDPPWRYPNEEVRSGRPGPRDYYPTMSTDEMCELSVQGRSVPDLAAPNSIMHLWTTEHHLLNGDAHRVLDAWGGFKPKKLRVWCKTKDFESQRMAEKVIKRLNEMVGSKTIAEAVGPQEVKDLIEYVLSMLIWLGLGSPIRTSTEFIILATRGNPNLTCLTNVPTWFCAPPRGHSVKPDEPYKVAERMGPHPFKGIELFARRKRPGWEVWGNEVNGDEDEAA
jgi:N6-adenosine-specific RNA methylase IME4